jgi:hypothetical protein
VEVFLRLGGFHLLLEAAFNAMNTTPIRGSQPEHDDLFEGLVMLIREIALKVDASQARVPVQQKGALGMGVWPAGLPGRVKPVHRGRPLPDGHALAVHAKVWVRFVQTVWHVVAGFGPRTRCPCTAGRPSP